MMGSVAERVVRTAPCPVLTVRHPEHEFVLPDALVRPEAERAVQIAAPRYRRRRPESRVILRDGTVANGSDHAPADLDARDAASSTSCPRIRTGAASSRSPTPRQLIECFCDSANRAGRPPCVLRLSDGELRPIAVGSLPRSRQGRGRGGVRRQRRVPGQGPRHDPAGTARGVAAANGFRAFEARGLPENTAMLEVFHESGFENPIEVGTRLRSRCACR
jgi:hypothetical protein